MKTTMKFFSLLIISAFLLSACGSGSQNEEAGSEHMDEEHMEGDHDEMHEDEDHEQEEHMEGDHEEHMDEEIVDNPRLGVEHMRDEDFSKISDENVNLLLESYMNLKNALVQSSKELAKESAEEMASILDESGESKVLNGIKEDVTHIMDTDKMEHMREHFELISENVYAIIKAKGASKTIYKQYCPMAFDNEGAFWLSSQEEIKNPYFGDKMLKCGKVQETLASK